MNVENTLFERGENFGCAKVFVNSQEVLDMGQTQFMSACGRIMSPFIIGTDEHKDGFIFYFDMTHHVDDYDSPKEAMKAMKGEIIESVELFEEAVFEEKWERR